MTRPRMKPYTTKGIRRVPCARCGAPSVHQWQFCSDGGQFRGICQECDLALNRLILKWIGFPNWQEMAKRYEAKARGAA